MDLRPTTKLDAVNAMLLSISELPVASLSGSGGSDVATALQALENTTREVQARGWDFNTEHEYPFMRDTEGAIRVPVNLLAVSFDALSRGDTDPVLRGTSVYDRKNHTYKFSRNLKGTAVFGLDFDDVPPTGRLYIAIRAARQFQDNAVGSDVMHKFDLRDEYQALADFTERHTDDADLNMLRDTPDFRLHAINTRRRQWL